MEILPEARSARTTAVLLLVIAAILLYLLLFHWFIMRHVEFASELGGLREQLARFEAVAAQREPMEQRLKEIRDSREDASLFLTGADFNEAAASMSDRLNRMVQTQAEDDCQIVSRQPVRPRAQERYERVTVNVRMRCQAEDMLKILYRLESATPMVMVDDLNVIRPRARRRTSGNDSEVAASLDIRFNMSGYLR
jgi:general secretion pathway protein M